MTVRTRPAHAGAEGGRRRRFRWAWWVAAACVAVGVALAAVAFVLSRAREATTPVAAMVPGEVTELVESAPGDLEAALAPEAAGLADPDAALPEGSVVDVRRATWSQVGANASLVADVTAPGGEPVAFLVVLAATGEGSDGQPDEWRIAGTFVLGEQA